MLGLRLRRQLARLLAIVGIAVLGLGALVAGVSLRPAQAQEELVGFRQTLDTYGRWVEHPRWGAVWVPDGTPADWRPYRLGHWVYTDEWGWYWVADEEWGWIAYHYGRWVFDHDLGLGWIWVPGTEWSPAWVSWRRGEEMIGWAPLPPEEVYVAVQDEPDFWLFVRAPDIVAPSLAVVILPAPQAILWVRQTVIINQTVIIRENNRVICGNPGVPPSFVAAKIGRPIQTVSVQPHVLAGTVGVTGAIVGAPPRGAPAREVIKPEAKLIQPAAHIPPPTPFRPGQRPELGPDAPNALKRANLAPAGPGGPAAPGTPGAPGSQGRQPGTPALSSRTPGVPGNVRPPSGSLQTGPKPDRAGQTPQGAPEKKPKTAVQTPGGNLPGTNQPPRPRPQTGPANVGPQGPPSRSLATQTPSNQPPPHLQRNQPPPNLQRTQPPPNLQRTQPPPSANLQQQPPANFNRPPPSNPAARQPPASPPPQSNAVINRAPPSGPPVQRPSPPPQSAVVHQPQPAPQRPASPPQQQQQQHQKCQTVNGQQVCR
jgi:uncharacterized protein DUF6600